MEKGCNGQVSIVRGFSAFGCKIGLNWLPGLVALSCH